MSSHPSLHMQSALQQAEEQEAAAGSVEAEEVVRHPLERVQVCGAEHWVNATVGVVWDCAFAILHRAWGGCKQQTCKHKQTCFSPLCCAQPASRAGQAPSRRGAVRGLGQATNIMAGKQVQRPRVRNKGLWSLMYSAMSIPIDCSAGTEQYGNAPTRLFLSCSYTCGCRAACCATLSSWMERSLKMWSSTWWVASDPFFKFSTVQHACWQQNGGASRWHVDMA